jgi:hypothetical protein
MKEKIAKMTPWGKTQTAEILAPGIVSYSTAGHGGIHIDELHEKFIMERYLVKEIDNFLGSTKWFEEDCDWAIPYYIFRDEIQSYAKDKDSFDRMLAAAINNIKRYKPVFAKNTGIDNLSVQDEIQIDKQYP